MISANVKATIKSAKKTEFIKLMNFSIQINIPLGLNWLIITTEYNNFIFMWSVNISLTENWEGVKEVWVNSQLGLTY